MESRERNEWRAADRLFQRLMDLDEPARSKALAASTVSAGVRAKLELMLDSRERGSPLLDQDGAILPEAERERAGSDERAVDMLRGQRIGDWRLVELIGRGGMATIYRAQRLGHDYAQQAAIKLLTVALRGPGEQARFRREQRILAQLRHPHIASLIDAGVAEDGTPYLALSLISGERIDRYCDRHGLGTAARVRLLLQVCAAVAYAHRQLVIHRDIKPGNILVDEDGHATLLDFGIARLLDPDGIREATITRAFTPEYSAPEQRNGGSKALGTPVDVYGLGAVLHRLLVGVAPQHDAHGDPVSASSVARERGDRHMAQALHGDLDAILAHCLAQNPDQRYASADALAGDLEAWLQDRPITARHASVWNHFGKLVRRNRMASALVVVALLAVASTVVALSVNHIRLAHRAGQLQAVVRFPADNLQKVDPEALGAYLQRRFAAALSKASPKGSGVDAATLAKVDFTTLAGAVMDHAMFDPSLKAAHTQLAGQPRVQAMILQTLANFYRVLHEFDKAAPVQQQATALFRKTLGVDDPQTLASMRDGLKLVRLMHPADGEARIRQVLALHQRYLGADDVHTAMVRASLGAWLVDSEPEQAEALLRRALAQVARVQGTRSGDAIRIRGDLARALAQQGKLAAAAHVLHQTVEQSRQVNGAEDANTLRLMHDLAWVESKLGQSDKAHALYQQLFRLDQRVFGATSAHTRAARQDLATVPATPPWQRRVSRGAALPAPH